MENFGIFHTRTQTIAKQWRNEKYKLWFVESQFNNPFGTSNEIINSKEKQRHQTENYLDSEMC